MTPKATPYFCPACKEEGEYYGRLIFPQEKGPFFCPNRHGEPEGVEPRQVPLRPVHQ